ncbi:MAG: hypothetical protein IIV99_04725 [Oscillospiraceae bacterium]|nr:hypothetical protein [Oscillospiraceae bacterium]
MTAKEIYENALALNMSHVEDEDDLEYYALKLLNIMLAETCVYNNQIREKKGLPPVDVPVVKDMEDEVGFEGEMLSPLCYSLASKLLQAQEETGLAAIYYNQYISLLRFFVPAVPVEVV